MPFWHRSQSAEQFLDGMSVAVSRVLMAWRVPTFSELNPDKAPHLQQGSGWLAWGT